MGVFRLLHMGWRAQAAAALCKQFKEGLQVQKDFIAFMMKRVLLTWPVPALHRVCPAPLL
jgi:hypothetical protein